MVGVGGKSDQFPPDLGNFQMSNDNLGGGGAFSAGAAASKKKSALVVTGKKSAYLDNDDDDHFGRDSDEEDNGKSSGFKGGAISVGKPASSSKGDKSASKYNPPSDDMIS